MATPSDAATGPLVHGAASPGASDGDVTRLVGTVASGPSEDMTSTMPAGRSLTDAPTRTVAGTPRPAGGHGAASGPLDVGEAFGERYQILRLLGMGGMGAVYQAWDSELEMGIALKVIRPDASQDAEVIAETERRFKRELLLARKVTHPNVVRIHDLGEINGIKYITMPFIEGTDLARVLTKRGTLKVPDVLPIARQIIAGLNAAHQAGVVHRDLKPANIMIDAEGHALIMDFGIARAGSTTEASGPVRAPRIPLHSDETHLGTTVGTLEYMAPEQARGAHVDQRADIYAFGLIVYRVLVGKRLAEGATNAFEDLAARMAAPPLALHKIDPSIPEDVDRIVTRCLQPDASARFQTSEELLNELNKLDDKGVRIPIARRLSPRTLGLVGVGILALLVGTYFAGQWVAPSAPESHEPVAVLIADFHNGTGDATFDGTLEPMLKLALEGAGFISAYDRLGIRRSLGVKPPDTLDESGARQIAVQQGLGVVLSGSLSKEGSGYGLTLKAAQAVTGEVIRTVQDSASSKDQVLAMSTRLATAVRKALGDNTSESSQRFAMEKLSATSLDAVREYAAAMDALSRSRFDDARTRFSKAVDIDPKFGLAYAGMAIASKNVDKQQDAERYIKDALRFVDGMTERERYRTRGLSYYLTSDYQNCVKEYSALIASYSGDAAARNNLALCLTYLRDMPRAVKEMQQVVKILPNRVLYRANLALYSAYAGAFQDAEREVAAIKDKPDLFATLAKAFAKLGMGQLTQATVTYESFGEVDPSLGPSYRASGLGDLAVYRGRWSEAVKIFEQGAAADLASKDSERASNKYAALAYTALLRQDKAGAIAAADKALELSTAVKIRFLAGRVYVEAGALDKAKTLAAGLASQLQNEPQAYAKIIEGDIALAAHDARQAIRSLTEANTLFDTWLGHYDLGRAYLEASAFAQADSEFDRLVKRRGEALSLFLDEEPTFGYFPTVYYYQGRVREGLNSSGFVDSYKTYLDIRGESAEDPLVPEVRTRARK